MPVSAFGSAIAASAVAEQMEPEAEGFAEITLPGSNLAAGGDCFGASGHPVVDPTNAARIWMGVDFQGIWRSEDYGVTWEHIASSGIITTGKIWGLEINCDGTRMLACCGAGANFLSIVASDNGGVTWSAIATDQAFESYSYKASPTDPLRWLATAHYSPSFADHVFESTNGGSVWASIGSTGSGALSGYAYYGLTHDTVLYVSDGDTPATGDTKRAVRSGTFGSFADVDNQSHVHGSHNMWVDRALGVIWNPGPAGLKLSDDDGATWTQLNSTLSASVCRSRGILLAGHAYATQGSNPGGPRIQQAAYPTGETFALHDPQPSYTNGPRAMIATVNPANQDVFILCNWTEPPLRWVGPVAA